ncbi:MAG: DNA polymerase III subunit beta [bacterium]
MKFTIKTEYLEKALNMANLIVPKKSPLLSLEGVKIQSQDSKVVLYTTDLENEYIASIEAEIFQEGQTVIPTKTLQQLISKIDYPEISFELEENKVILTAMTFTAELPTIDPSEYPEMTLSTSDFTTILEITPEEFKQGIDSVVYASTYPDESNPVFSSILFEIQKQYINLVATDGSQLAYKKLNIKTNKNTNLIIPIKSIKVIQKYIDNPLEIQTDNQESPKLVCFKTNSSFGEIRIVSKLVEANFPEYKEVIPTEYQTSITLNKKHLLDAIKRVMVLSKSKELSGIVIFQILKNKLIIKSIESELGKAKEEITLSNKQGKDQLIYFNGKFIETMLNSIDTDQIEIHFIDETSPMKVTIPNDDSFLFLLMPVRITATV